MYLLSRNLLNFIPCFLVVTFWLYFVSLNNITFCQLFLFLWKFLNYNTSNVNVFGMSWFLSFLDTNLICFADGYLLRGYFSLRYLSVICTRFVVVCIRFVKLFTLWTVMVNLVFFRFLLFRLLNRRYVLVDVLNVNLCYFCLLLFHCSGKGISMAQESVANWRIRKEV